jgi:hypothetical protein
MWPFNNSGPPVEEDDSPVRGDSTGEAEPGMTRATSANSGRMVEGAAPAVEPTGDPEPESAVEAARRLTPAMEFNDSFHDSIEYDESEPAVEGTRPMVETVDSPGDAAPSLVAAKDGSPSLVDSASNSVDSSNAGGSPSLVATDSNNNCTTIHGETATTAAATTHGLFDKEEEKALLALLQDYDPKAADDTAQNKSEKARKLYLETRQTLTNLPLVYNANEHYANINGKLVGKKSGKPVVRADDGESTAADLCKAFQASRARDNPNGGSLTDFKTFASRHRHIQRGFGAILEAAWNDREFYHTEEQMQALQSDNAVKEFLVGTELYCFACFCFNKNCNSRTHFVFCFIYLFIYLFLQQTNHRHWLCR